MKLAREVWVSSQNQSRSAVPGPGGCSSGCSAAASLAGRCVQRADSTHRGADNLTWLMSNLWKRLTSVWLVAWKPPPQLFPCARCECSQRSTDRPKPPSCLQGEGLGRKAAAGGHVPSLYFEGSYVYIYSLEKLCSAPAPSLAVLGALLSKRLVFFWVKTSAEDGQQNWWTVLK